jgi:hypothetical protein
MGVFLMLGIDIGGGWVGVNVGVRVGDYVLGMLTKGFDGRGIETEDSRGERQRESNRKINTFQINRRVQRKLRRLSRHVQLVN